MGPLSGDYKACLNSSDRYDPELPLFKSKAHGGTLILWKTQWDPYITTSHLTTTSFLPIVFQPPGIHPTIHIAVYLPTAGQDSLFIDELAKLNIAVEELANTHPEAPIYLRGDFNASFSNARRSDLLRHFASSHGLIEVPIPSPTYHHFTGNGLHDSYLDRLFFSETVVHAEVLVNLQCKLNDPLINSHHDMIISSWSSKAIAVIKDTEENITAPRIKNERLKVLWSDTGIQEYQDLISPHLVRLQELWLACPSKNSIALLLSSTNHVMASCAFLTNKTVPLSSPPQLNRKKTPWRILKSQRNLLKKRRLLRLEIAKESVNVEQLVKDFNQARTAHRKLERYHRAELSRKRDEKLFQLISSNPNSIFKSIKSSKRGVASRVHKLRVGNKVYHDKNIGDGFFDSISSLKYRDNSALSSSTSFKNFSSECSNILEICRHGSPIPEISETKCMKLMERMKPDVNDINAITVNHFLHAGIVGCRHFCLLLNTLIKDINVTSINEINTVHAIILFKGHFKDRTLARSYRTISSCPVVAKALDLYVRDLHIESWNQDQAPTQFQGEGSSHELAAILLSESIQHSLHTIRQPIFILYLDAQSAFDVVLKEPLLRNLYHNGSTNGEALMYINNRLSNRKTFVDWEGELMGPILDERGLEQGGVSSSDFYKIYGKEQLMTAQDSALGVSFGKDLVVSAIGQADDTVVVSNDLHKLNCLLQLSLAFCKKYNVSLSPGKTKLQVMCTSTMKTIVDHAAATIPLFIDGCRIDFEENVEHVGLLRSSAGNLPTILEKFSAHNKALGAVLHAGMGRGHRGNPAASLHAETVYGVPVLLSGLAALVLQKSEVSLINQHHKEVLRNLQRLHPGTPRSVIYFLAGSLPGEALLHIRQLTLFGMISRLPQCMLFSVAKASLSSTPPARSWFSQIFRLFKQYQLGNSFDLLCSPIPKEAFKKLVKKRVLNYWEQHLREELENSRYSSLTFFKPQFMSLMSPHPLWRSAGSSPSNIVMATVQAQMVSGRFRTERLCRHWSMNKLGICLLSPNCCDISEDVPHILQTCAALHETRLMLLQYTRKYCENIPPHISALILLHTDLSSPEFCQFLLDCSTLPDIIRATQEYDANTVYHHCFTVTRTWIYSLHKKRLKILGRWKIF